MNALLKKLPKGKANRQILFDKELCGRRLRQFIRRAWHIVEPATPYIDGWHIDAICEHLEAVHARQIRNLLINVPPRHMKSLCVSVFFPMWVWGPKAEPHTRWLFGSYAQDLAIRDSLKCRRIIESEWFQARWGDLFQLTGDQNQKSRFENDRTGYRLAVGVGGAATGEGGDYLVFDDPHKVLEADSKNKLDEAWNWWSNVMGTRGNNPKTVSKIGIMQRVAQNDVAGRIIDSLKNEAVEPWEILCLPARWEPQPYISTIGWKDPRTTPGELIWPERFPENEQSKLEAGMSPLAVAGQMQQRPAPAGGAIYLKEWWDDINRYDAGDPSYRNKCIGRWLSLDTGFSERDEASYSCIETFELLPDYRALLRKVDRRHVNFTDLTSWAEQSIRSADRDMKLKGVIIENKASGISLIQTLKQILPEEYVKLLKPFEPVGSKEDRAHAATPWCANGSILLPYPSEQVPWLMDFEDEIYTFPNSTYKDQADTFAQAIDYLRNLLEQGLKTRMGFR